jgi:hypothetical protein
MPRFGREENPQMFGYVDVCWIEEPFICGVHGEFTLDNLKEIEKSLIEDEFGFANRYKGQESVRFVARYIPGEVQYGEGYGDVYTIPGYIVLEPEANN